MLTIADSAPLLHTATPLTASVLPFCLLTAAAIGLLASWRIATDRWTPLVLGALCIAALVATARLMAHRVGLDIIDLSESASRTVAGEMSRVAMVVGIASLILGSLFPRLLKRLTSSNSMGDRNGYLGICVAALTVVSALAGAICLSGVSRTAGVNVVTLSIATLLASLVGAVIARMFLGGRASLMLCVATSAPLVILLTLPKASESTAIWLACLAFIALSGMVLACTPIKRPDHTSQLMPGIRRLLGVMIACTATITIPGVLDTARAAFAKEATAYVAQRPPKPIDDSPITAVCIGPEKFAIVLPAMGENGADLALPGMLLDRSQFDDPTDLAHLEVGTVIPASPVGSDLEAKRFQLKAKVGHGDHFHDYDFAIVNANKAELREMALMFGAHLSSRHVLLGLLAGVGMTMLAFRSMTARRPKLLFASMFLLAVFVPMLGGVAGAIGLIIGAGLCAVPAFGD